MKKFILIVAVAIFLTACHSSTTKERTSCDTSCVNTTDTIVVKDSIKTAK